MVDLEYLGFLAEDVVVKNWHWVSGAGWARQLKVLRRVAEPWLDGVDEEGREYFDARLRNAIERRRGTK